MHPRHPKFIVMEEEQHEDNHRKERKKKMFAVLTDNGENREFKIYPTHEAARGAAIEECNAGMKATIYDYDAASDTFIEFYQMY